MALREPIGVYYRREASRAFLTAMGISLAMLIGVGLGLVAGWRAWRGVALLLLDACMRVWAAVPVILHLVVHGLLAVGLLSLGVWIWSVSQQWWTTRRLVERSEMAALEAPAVVRDVAARHGLDRDVIVLPEERPLAVTAGVLSPRIILSSGLIDALDEEELEAVLLHERHHLVHRDPLKLTLGRGAARALFYLPVIGELLRRYQAASELAADAAAIHAQGDPAPLGTALVKLLRVQATQTAGAVSFQGAAELRVSHLLDPGAVVLPAVSRSGAVRSLVAVSAVLGLTVILQLLPGIVASSPLLVRCVV